MNVDALIDRVCVEAASARGATRDVVSELVDRLAPLATAIERRDAVDGAVARLEGFDRLHRYLADESIDEVLVARGDDVWIERAGVLTRVDRLRPGTIGVVLQRVLAGTGRRLDRTNPIVDTRLPDGSRLCAAVDPIAVDGTAVAIRRHRVRRVDLASFGDPAVTDIVQELLDRRANVLVSGATSSGKTTLVAAALARLPVDERIVVVEDTAEIDLPTHHLVRLEARPATVDGVRAIDAAELVRTALRLRPDRIVVGEFRGDEALAAVQAFNTGHDGSWSTCHANGALDALTRLHGLVLQAAPTWPMAAIRAQVARSIDAVVHVIRHAGARRIAQVLEPDAGDGEAAGRVVVDGGVRVGELRRRR